MAGAGSLAATGRSIARYLNHCFDQEQPVEGRNTVASLVRTEDLDDGLTEPALSIYLFKIDIARAMRAAWSGLSHLEGRARLPLELHFLITAWAENADFEQRILGRTIECLESRPILTGPLLDPLGQWQAGEAVQLCLEDLSTEDVMRTFDSLPVNYKLSLCYLARVVRVDAEARLPEPTVGETRSQLSAGRGGPV